MSSLKGNMRMDTWFVRTLRANLWVGCMVMVCGWGAARAQGDSRLIPVPEAGGVCPDMPLRISFNAPPVLTHRGKIQVFDAAKNVAVETIDTTPSPLTAIQPIGGVPNFKYYPVTVDGNTASIHLRNGALAYHTTYYVLMDAGVFAGDAGIIRPTEWRFTTKAEAPATGSTQLTIAADGTGDFATVQGAVDWIPDGNKTPTTLFIHKGTYTEIVCFMNKHELSFVGEDRKQTVICYANNNNFNSLSDMHIYHRGVFLSHHCDDLRISNLTLKNSTPQGGSQAEAIILNGTLTAQAIVSNVDLYSFQDTLQINGQAYIHQCYIEGDVDFMWGKGPCFFEDCECKALRSKAYYTQIRNPPPASPPPPTASEPEANHGYVYYHCIFDGAAKVRDVFLSRIAPAVYPCSEMVLIDCTLTDAVNAVAWKLDGIKGEPQTEAGSLEQKAARVHFWEYNSHGADHAAVDVSKRLSISRQLRAPEDAALVAEFSDPEFVLGHGWDARGTEAAATRPGVR